MKLSKRERFLIGLLILVTIWVLAFRFLIAPSYSSFLYTRQVLKEMEQEKVEMDLYLDQFPDLDEQIQELEEERSLEYFFYQNIDDVFVDTTLQSMAEEAGVDIGRMSIGEPSSMELPPEAAGEFGEEPLMERVVTMKVECRDIHGIMEFAHEIYRQERSLVISYVDMKRESRAATAQEAGKSDMKGIVEVKFYYEKTS